MGLQKIKLVVSDFHLGKGRFLEDGSVNVLEDFFLDEKFIEFIDYYSSGVYRKVEVELIINGDFMNLLQIDYREDFPEIIDEEVAVAKTEKIVWGHRELFESLKLFAARPRNTITMLVGNHDPGLLFPGVREYLKKVVAADIYFPNLSYKFDGVHLEHGCQLDIINAFNPEQLFLTKGLASPVLNLPWGSQFLVNILNKVKKKRPFIDKIKPFRRYYRWSLLNDTGFAVKTSLQVAYYFIKTRLIRSKYRTSRLTKTIQILKSASINQNLDSGAKKIFEKDRTIHTVVMGHTHAAKVAPMGAGRTYINTGTWNDLIHLGIDAPGRYIKLTYAEISYSGGPKPTVLLKEWRGLWHEEVTLSF